MGKVGFLDSGFGGLAIMRDVVAHLPQYDYVYLGDTARGPYGPLQRQEVIEYTQQAVDFLFVQDCELVILACNTATCQALRFIQQEYLPKRSGKGQVLGVIIPAVEEAIDITKNGRIGVMATAGTVESGSFVTELQKHNPDVQVFQQACPALVPLIEAGEHHSDTLLEALHEYTQPLLSQQVDTIILGCTHYGLIADDIAKVVGPNVTVVSEGALVAKKLADYLHRHPELDKKLSQQSQRDFYSTRADSEFNRLGSEFYGDVVQAQQADLK